MNSLNGEGSIYCWVRYFRKIVVCFRSHRWNFFVKLSKLCYLLQVLWNNMARVKGPGSFRVPLPPRWPAGFSTNSCHRRWVLGATQAQYSQLSLKRTPSPGTKATVRFREVSAWESSVTEIQVQFGREWTKFAVRFREVSGLERVDCISISGSARLLRHVKTGLTQTQACMSASIAPFEFLLFPAISVSSCFGSTLCFVCTADRRFESLRFHVCVSACARGFRFSTAWELGRAQSPVLARPKIENSCIDGKSC